MPSEEASVASSERIVEFFELMKKNGLCAFLFMMFQCVLEAIFLKACCMCFSQEGILSFISFLMDPSSPHMSPY